MKLRALVALAAAICAAVASPRAQEECPLFGEDPLGGYVRVHGDVLVPPEYFEEGGFTLSLWQGGLVRYFVENSVGSNDLQRIEAAMADWENAASVDFSRYYGHTGWHVHIRDANPGEFNFSGIGQGTYDIAITNWGDHAVLLHELGHCLGYWHEQSRPDRNAYVQIHEPNIEPGQEHNFAIEPYATTYGPYDFDSVMHYTGCAFTIWGQCGSATPWAWTIEALPPNQDKQDSMGFATSLSYLDRTTMSFVYPQPDWRFLDINYGGTQSDGSFRFPYKTFFAATALTPTDGTLWIQPGTYSAVGLYDEPITLRAPLTDVVLR